MAAVMSENHRPQTRQLGADIEGVHTDILCTWFADRIMVVVTQFKKFGTLVSIQKDQVVSQSQIPGEITKDKSTFTTKILMGIDEPIWHVYGQQIAAAVGESDEANRPVLLAIALKKHSPEILQCILKQLEELKAKKPVT